MAFPPTGVRCALPEDEEDILVLLRIRHKEHGELCGWDDNLVRNIIRNGIERRGGYIGVIRGPDGVEGTVGLFMSRDWYSNDVYLADRWLFVDPHKRQGAHARNLVAFAKWVAEDLGVQLRLSTIGHDKDGLMILCARKLTPIGRLFTFDGRPKRSEEEVVA